MSRTRTAWSRWVVGGLCVLSAARVNGLPTSPARPSTAPQGDARADGEQRTPNDGPAKVKRVPPDSIVTLMVPATTPWTDTGITLSTGDAVEIRTWGRVIFDNSTGLTATPKGSGQHGGGCTFVVTDVKVPPHGVVGNVAPAMSLDGQGFFVGAAWKGLVPVSGSSAPQGRLFLGFNGSDVLCDRTGYDSWAFGVNHAGWFTAEVSITRARTPSRPD